MDFLGLAIYFGVFADVLGSCDTHSKDRLARNYSGDGDRTFLRDSSVLPVAGIKAINDLLYRIQPQYTAIGTIVFYLFRFA